MKNEVAEVGERAHQFVYLTPLWRRLACSVLGHDWPFGDGVCRIGVGICACGYSVGACGLLVGTALKEHLAEARERGEIVLGGRGCYDCYRAAPWEAPCPAHAPPPVPPAPPRSAYRP